MNNSQSIHKFCKTGTKVILVSNEEEDHITYAKIIGFTFTGFGNNIPILVFQDESGEQFGSGAYIMNDTPEVRKMLEFTRAMFPNAKEHFWFYVNEVKNFGSTLDYLMESAAREIAEKK